MTAVDDRLLDDLRDAYAAIFGSRVHPDDNFFDLGRDSLSAEELMIEVQRLTGLDLPTATLLFHPSTRDLAQHIAECRAAGDRE